MYADEVEKERGTGRKTFKKTFTSARGGSSGIEGKWKRDMFQTANRSPKASFVTKKRQSGGGQIMKTVGGGVTRNITTAAIRGRTQPVAVREVQTGPATLFISNLANTVTQEDIEELFEQYEPEVVQLHFGADGVSLGTADLVVPRAQVALIQKNLEGVLLDGKQIEVLETNTAKPVSVFDRIKKVGRQNDFKPRTMRVTVQQKGSRFVKRGAREDF